MDTVQFLLADGNGPFRIAAAIVLLLGFVEIVGLLVGMAPSGVLDSLLPDFHAPHAETDTVGAMFSWLNVGRVPTLVLLIAFLTSFAVAGLVVQAAAASFAAPLPAVIAWAPAFLAAVPTTRLLSRFLGRVLPYDETYALDSETLIGRVAVVSLGPVTHATPGKARVAGPQGGTHFVRVRAARKGDRFEQGREVLLVERHKSLFDVIEPPAHLRNETS